MIPDWAFHTWFSRSVEWLAMSEDLPPDRLADFHLQLGQGYARFGQRREAERSLRKALAIAEKNRLNEMTFQIEAALGALKDQAAPNAEVFVSSGAEEAVAAYDAAVEQARADLAEAGVDPAGTGLSLVRLQSDTEIRLETPESFPGQVIEDLGFARPAAQLRGEGGTDFVPHSYENLDRADGDAVFVLAGSGYPDAPDTFSDGLWADLDAGGNGRLYRVDYDLWGSANLHGAHRIVEDVTAALTGRTDPAV